MRWQLLFDDLAAQAAALGAAERSGEVDERTRGEFAALTLFDRTRVAVGSPLRIRAAGAGLVNGTLARAGPDWLLVDEGTGREALIVARAVVSVRGLARYSGTPDGASVVESRLGLRSAIRGLARDRSAVRLHLVDGTVLDATVDRVGADFVEVALHPVAEPRRPQAVIDVEVVPLAAIAIIRRAV